MSIKQHRAPLVAWPVIDGPFRGQLRAWAADSFYVAELPPVAATPQGAPRRCDDGPHRTEYHLRAGPKGSFFWSCEPLE